MQRVLGALGALCTTALAAALAFAALPAQALTVAVSPAAVDIVEGDPFTVLLGTLGDGLSGVGAIDVAWSSTGAFTLTESALPSGSPIPATVSLVAGPALISIVAVQPPFVFDIPPSGTTLAPLVRLAFGSAAVEPGAYTVEVSASFDEGTPFRTEFAVNVAAIPEPSTVVLLVAGLLGIGGTILRRRA